MACTLPYGRGSDSAVELGNLAMTYYGRGDYGRAEALLKQAIARLGTQSEDYASALNNLAAIYKNGGAVFGSRSVMETRRSKFGSATDRAGARQNATVLHNLGDLYLHTAQYGPAEASARRALALRQQLFGTHDMYVAQSMNLLAATIPSDGADTGEHRYGPGSIGGRASRHTTDRTRGLAEYLINLGAGLRHSGDFRGADECLTRALPGC